MDQKTEQDIACQIKELQEQNRLQYQMLVTLMEDQLRTHLYLAKLIEINHVLEERLKKEDQP